MEKTIEIPEGYKARIDGNKVIIEPKESKDELFDHRYAQHLVEDQRQKSMIQRDSQKIRQEIKSMADSFKQVIFIADSYGNSYIKWDAKSEESVIKLLEQALEYMKTRVL